MSLQAGTELEPLEDEAVTNFGRDGSTLMAVEDGSVFTSDPLDAVDVDGQAPAAVMWRAALHRRLLALADVASVMLASVLVLNTLGQRKVAFAAVVGAALILFLFKVAGLYDRDELRLVHSTLDEVPVLLQLTGLFALGLAILQTFLFSHHFNADQIAALWIITFVAVVVGRVLVRAAAGRTSRSSAALWWATSGGPTASARSWLPAALVHWLSHRCRS